MRETFVLTPAIVKELVTIQSITDRGGFRQLLKTGWGQKGLEDQSSYMQEKKKGQSE